MHKNDPPVHMENKLSKMLSGTSSFLSPCQLVWIAFDFIHVKHHLSILSHRFCTLFIGNYFFFTLAAAFCYVFGGTP